MILRDPTGRIVVGDIIAHPGRAPTLRAWRPGCERELTLDAASSYLVLTCGVADRVELRDAGVDVDELGRLVVAGSG